MLKMCGANDFSYFSGVLFKTGNSPLNGEVTDKLSDITVLCLCFRFVLRFLDV